MKQDAAGSKSSIRAEHASSTLWSACTHEQYFLLPDALPMVEAMPNAPVPEGMFELCTLTGRRRLVRDEEVRSYEVTRDKAIEWLFVELDPAIQELKDAAIERAERMLDETESSHTQNTASSAPVKKARASTWPRPAKPAHEDTSDAADEE
jgi:phage I-like protein